MNPLEILHFNADGLIPAIAVDHEDGTVLMMAWMNREAVEATIEEGIAVYWSRSRNALWRKGETSGSTQKIVSIRVDCDQDTLLLEVEQKGVACHTGRRSCFYRTLQDEQWVETLAVEIDPARLYGSKHDE